MTPGEALARLFLDNADHGRNAANDELVMALRQRAREIAALADLAGPIPGAGRDSTISASRLPTEQSTAPEQGRDHTVITIVSIPATELITIDPMASVDMVAWSCRICDHQGTTTTQDTAHAEGVEHLSAEHYATIA